MTCLARPSVGLVVRTDPRRWRLAKINRNRQCGVSRIRQRRVTCATKTSRFSDTPVPKARVLAKAVAVVASVLCVFGACDTSGLNNLASAAGTIDSIGIDKTKTNEKKITQITPRDYVRRAQQETKKAQRELSIAAAKKAEAESEIKKASAEKKFALEQEGEYKKREREAARKIKNAKWITDTATATTAATGYDFFSRKILLALYCVRRVPLWRFLVRSCEGFLIIPIRRTHAIHLETVCPYKRLTSISKILAYSSCPCSARCGGQVVGRF